VQIRDPGGDRQGKFRSSDPSVGSQNGTAHRHQDYQVRGNDTFISRWLRSRVMIKKPDTFAMNNVWCSQHFSGRVCFPSAPRRFLLFKQRELSLSLQEQEKIPSSGSHRSENLGASQKEGFGGELAAQCDTHARIFLLQESSVHQFWINEVSEISGTGPPPARTY